MGLMDSEASFRKGYKKASMKSLINAAETMGLGGDYNLKDLSKSEIIQIIESYMGFNKKNRGGYVAPKKKYGIVDNLKKKK